MTNWDSLVGHEWAIEVLRSAIQFDRVGHAYLFTGPDQVGKTTIAKVFAQALNCTAEDLGDRPCGRCRSCLLIESERHPDIRLVAGEKSGRGNITLKIDQIRQLQQDLNLTATEARYQVAIIQKINTASLGAANAFLKTLEEPPPNVVLILTANDAETLLPTIPSRCRTINLRPLPVNVILDALRQRWSVEPERARLLAHLSGGRIGWALKHAADDEALSRREEHLGWLTGTFNQSRVERFTRAEKLAKDPEELADILRTWLSWWRDLVLISAGGSENDALINIDRIEELRACSESLVNGKAMECLQQTEQSITYLEQNANVRLVIENLLLGYPIILI